MKSALYISMVTIIFFACSRRDEPEPTIGSLEGVVKTLISEDTAIAVSNVEVLTTSSTTITTTIDR